MADVSLIVGTTLADWAPDIADSVSDRNAFMAYMKTKDGANKGKGGYRERMVVVEGGNEFRETVFFNLNSTFKGYADRGTIDTAVGNPIKEAQYAHKIVAGTINISLLEEAQNTTKYQIHNLAKVKRQEAEISMSEVMGASALSDGATDTLIPGGLAYLIPASNGVVGTIDGVANAAWRPQRDATGVSAWNTSDEGLIALDALFEACVRGSEKPDAIVTTIAVKSLINIMQIKNHNINVDQNADMAKLGFDTIKYRGATVMADDNVTAGYVYLVNTAYTRFQVLSKGNFKMTEMKQPVGGLYNCMQLYVFCNFTGGALRLNGLMTGVTG